MKGLRHVEGRNKLRGLLKHMSNKEYRELLVKIGLEEDSEEKHR